ncbi:hypothetical protein AURDEDRAFT_185606 [Auricularia subglabra TFB-10046 SS5]|nr:hypothetical protein AURDEDRAFT_185606 [Auricularia subglabra TFB-10046 SS5]
MTAQDQATELASEFEHAIRGRFNEIYRRFSSSAGGSAGSPVHVACLSDAVLVRDSIVNSVESLHSALRFRMSASARINQLPDDVLVHLMAAMPLKDLVIATHVCHRWRALGVGTPALWTRLTVTNATAAGAEILLARSKAASIDLKINLTFDPARRVRVSPAEILSSPHMDRVRSLAIHSEEESHPELQVLLERAPRRHPATSPPLCPASRLEKLHIDKDIYDGGPAQRLPFDCSTLREARIVRGVDNLDFLHVCNHLRVLVLHIPRGVSGVDVLRIVHANPFLHTVELHVPQYWTGNQELAAQPLSDLDGPPPACEIERFVVCPGRTFRRTMTMSMGVPPFVPDELRTSLYDATLFFVTRLDCAHIPALEVSCRFKTAEDALCGLLLSHLHNLSSAVLGPDSLRLHDAHGYTRRFSRLGPGRPLRLALPFLRTGPVRALDMRLLQWTALAAAHGVAELPCLEELTLRADIGGFAAMKRGSGVACPALRRLTVVQSYYEIETFRPPGGALESDFVVVAMAVPRECLRRCPPLEQLTIVRDASLAPLEDQTLRFAPPLPQTVFVTSALSELPPLLRDWESDSESDSSSDWDVHDSLSDHDSDQDSDD